MSKYKQLSLEEREKLYAYRLQGWSFRQIGRLLGRHHTTLKREVKRNGPYFQGYLPCKAQLRYMKRTSKQRRKAPLKSPLIYLYVREHLRMGWSPEQIAGRLKVEQGLSVCIETIYRYIYQNKRERLWRYLKLSRKKRMKKGERRVRQGRIPCAVSIDVRPRSVNRRKELGHWESDLMEGKRSMGVISATVERYTRYTLLTKIGGKTAWGKVRTLVEQLGGLPANLRKTLTLDNGTENTNHQQMTESLGLSVYFCHAYHAWEKGTIENTIGRLRRYLPKGIDLTYLTDENLQLIENHMNHTPRKCLGYLTPYEKMSQYLNSRPD